MATAFISQLYTKCKTHGNGDAQVLLTDSELCSLIKISFIELGYINLAKAFDFIEIPDNKYYNIPLDWFESLSPKQNYSSLIISSFENAVQINNDYYLYIQNLSSLHRRRIKYKRILSTQSFPSMDQISPRTLLEYGVLETNLLCNWMTWRKWMYDIDNRSAQETGYLFEPILAACLGGEALGSRNSPVKRLNENEAQTSSGRQVDCYVASTRTAYEFKLRVTIAASGQGRFSEELSFPVECNAAGIKPILLVLDPTPSPRLTDLEAAYVAANGEAYHGERAWATMNEAAGETMSTFINSYIRPPLEQVEAFQQGFPDEISIKVENNLVILTSGGFTYNIKRES
jgi:hypothetical protein